MGFTEENNQRNNVMLILNVIKAHGPCNSSQISAILKDDYGVYISPKEMGHLIKNNEYGIRIDRFKDGRTNKYRIRKWDHERKRNTTDI